MHGKSKYCKHMRKLCAKAGKETEYNNIHRKYVDEAKTVCNTLDKERVELQVSVEQIGKRYTEMLHKDMELEGVRIKELQTIMDNCRKEYSDINKRIDERHKYYQKCTQTETDAINQNFVSRHDSMLNEITKRMESEIHIKLGYLE